MRVHAGLAHRPPLAADAATRRPAVLAALFNAEVRRRSATANDGPPPLDPSSLHKVHAVNNGELSRSSYLVGFRPCVRRRGHRTGC
jgi:hypothetical protein